MEGFDNLVEEAARQISSANTSGEQSVAGNQLLFGRKKADAAFGMPRREKHVGSQRAGLQGICLADVVINFHFAGRRNSDP